MPAWGHYSWEIGIHKEYIAEENSVDYYVVKIVYKHIFNIWIS